MQVFLIISCDDDTGTDEPHHENFEKRTVNLSVLDALDTGKTYLSVCSRIYSFSKHETHNLTISASIRNIDVKGTLYITKTEYFDTHANPINTYSDKSVYGAPIVTL